VLYVGVFVGRCVSVPFVFEFFEFQPSLTGYAALGPTKSNGFALSFGLLDNAKRHTRIFF
jgi:hypothetical protein